MLTHKLPGNYWKDIDSLIVSHVANESGSFVPQFMRTEADSTTFINDFMPEPQLAPVRAAVETQYPAQGPPYNGDQRARAGCTRHTSTAPPACTCCSTTSSRPRTTPSTAATCCRRSGTAKWTRPSA